jgi:hypothetical protein
MSFNLQSIIGLLGTPATGSLDLGSQDPQFQQNLQQLEQTATSNPQAATQLLQSLPPAQRHALMQALRAQDPQAAQSLHAFFQQQQQASTSTEDATTATAQTRASSIVSLVSTIGKMAGGSNTQPATTGPVGGYDSFASMEA